MAGGYQTMASMMGGQGATAQVPTQSFSAANFIGTPVPVVGDNKGIPNYASSVGGISSMHVIFVMIALIGAGYLLYHLNFEK
jgi:hypothetical protein